MNLYERALSLAEKGFYVFPLLPGSKLPAIDNFPNRATRDPDLIRCWWYEDVMGLVHPYNIGIYCGRFGDDPTVSLAVLDEDNKDGRDGAGTLAALVMCGMDMPETRTQTTPSTGRHHLTWTRHPIANTVQKLGPGLDTRGVGGFIVGEGSVTEKGVYTSNGLPVAEATPEFLAKCTKHVERVANRESVAEVDTDRARARFSDYLKHRAPLSMKGDGGDATAYQVACRGRDYGLSEEATLEAMLGPDWDDGCGWSPNRLAEKVANAYRYAKGIAGNHAPETEFTAVDVPEAKPIAGVTVEPRMPSDADIAASFTTAHGDGLLYCAEHARWYVDDGTRYAPDSTHLARDLMRRQCEHIGHKVRERMLAANPDKPAAADNAAARISSTKTIFGAEQLARADRVHAVAADVFDSDPFVLNTPGGLVDLRSGVLGPHRRDARCSKITAAGFGGPCAAWRGLVDHLSEGDELFRRYLQKLCGYALTGSVREHIFMFIYGRGGTGKSTFTEVLAEAMGDYACTAAPNIFTARGDGQHPTGLAALRGKRLILAPETEQGTHWNEPLVKSFTGGDRVTARFMRGDFFEFEPAGKLIFTGNHQPHVRDIEDGMRRRIQIIPFDRKPAAPDKTLRDRLRAELGGILAWAAEGTRMWLAEGLESPAAVRRATAAYFDAEDDIGRWLAERIDTNGDTSTIAETAALYADWTTWVKVAGGYVGTQKRLSADLARRGHEPTNHPRTRRHGFRGLVLRHPYAHPAGAS